MLHWKVNPTEPGTLATFDLDTRQFKTEAVADFAAMGFRAARIVFGSWDLNENLGVIETDFAKPEPVIDRDGVTMLFHRSERDGNVLSHVYLRAPRDEREATMFAPSPALSE